MFCDFNDGALQQRIKGWIVFDKNANVVDIRNYSNEDLINLYTSTNTKNENIQERATAF